MCLYRTTENSLRIALLFAKIAERDAKSLDLMLEEFQSLGHSFKGHCCRGPHELPLLNAAVAMRSPGLIRVLFKYKVDLDLRRLQPYGRVRGGKERPARDPGDATGGRREVGHPGSVGRHALSGLGETELKACFRILLRHGASPDSRELDGRRRPVLTIAAGLRDLTIARELLQAGADVNAVDEEGTTALHKAIQTSGLSMVELLLFQYKAQPDVPQKSEGVTPGTTPCYGLTGCLSRCCWRWRGRSLRRMARAWCTGRRRTSSLRFSASSRGSRG